MKTKDKVKKVVFFYSPSEVDEYIRNAGNKPASTGGELFIAMTPIAHSCLKQKGIMAQNTLRYFTNDSHMKLLKKSKVLVDWLRRESDFVDFGIGFDDAFRDSFIFYIRFAIHYCLRAIEIILNTIDMHQPEVLSVFSSGKRFVSSLFIEPEEEYLGHIVNVTARKKSLKCEGISKTTDRSSSSYLAVYLDSLIKFIYKYGKFQLWETMVLGKGLFTKTRFILLTTRHYQMVDLAEQIRKEYSKNRFHFLQGPVMPSFGAPDFIIKLFCGKFSKKISTQKKMFVELEEVIKNETDFFSYRGIPFGELICKKIRDNVTNNILGLMLWSIRLSQFIDKSKPSVIISNGNRSDDMVLAKLCQHKNIPTILISHGSHVYPKNEYEGSEWGEHGRFLLRAPFSFLALQSPIAEGYLNAFPSKSNVIKTGPLIWGKPVKIEESKKLFKKMFNGKHDFGKIKIVLHAGTPKQSNYQRFYVYETPDEYVQAIRELASAVEKIDDTILIVKFRPGKEITVNDLKQLIPFSEKVILSVNESFISVLGMSDLLVSFSSTTIEEALQNKIPVLLYGGEGRYQHVPAFEIKRNEFVPMSAVYHVREEEDLNYAVSRIIRLNINKDKDKNLFNPYIYPEESRTLLGYALKQIQQEELV